MILGHRNQVRFLQKSISNNTIAHAYLFDGPQMLGKKKVAIEFIKALFCEQKKIGGCNICKNCRDIESKKHPNVIFVENHKEIQISFIRFLKTVLNLKSDYYKVVVFDDAHNLNLEASNSFLKILEEPRGDVVFILITDKPELLLKTIISRLQRIRFFPVSNSELKNFLHKKIQDFNISINDRDLEDLLIIVNGRPGILFRFIENPQILNQLKEIVSGFIKFFESDILDRFELIENYQQDLAQILNIWIVLIHYLLMKKININNNFNFFNQNYQELLNIDLISASKYLLKINSLIRTDINKRLALEAYACLI